MAQYKVIQDIEAEDKLLGPLSLRQFIYAAITIALGFIAFRLFMTSIWFLGIIFVPPALFFGLLAAPLGGQQSSEIWLLAKIRFMLKPRRRIWDQTGIQQLVTITVPKKVERHLTKGYSDDEVKSRLKTLAATLDTRGWAVKNATAPVYGQAGNSDRLLDIAEQPTPTVYVEPTADMLDPNVNPRAQAMEQMIDKSAQQHRAKVVENMKKYAEPSQNKTSSETDAERALLERIHKQQAQPSELGSHMKTIQPPGHTNKNHVVQQGQTKVTTTHDPAILNLVENSEGLSVKTIAGQANRVKNNDSDDEVVISLH